MTRRTEWTDTRKDTLCRLLEEGLNYRQAAERMGIRRDQAKSAAHAHGLGLERSRAKCREWARHELVKRRQDDAVGRQEQQWRDSRGHGPGDQRKTGD